MAKTLIILMPCAVFLLGMPVGLSWLGGRLDAKEAAWQQHVKAQIDAGFAVPFRYHRFPSFIGAVLFLFVALSSGIVAIRANTSAGVQPVLFALLAMVCLAGGFPYLRRAVSAAPAFVLSNQGIVRGRWSVPWSEIESASRSVVVSQGPTMYVLTLRFKTLQVPYLWFFKTRSMRMNISSVAHREFLVSLMQSKIAQIRSAG